MKSASIDLTITGRKCRTHRNDTVARSLDQGSNLIEISGRQHTHANNNWNNNNDDDGYDDDDAPSQTETCSSSSVLVDRYDARTLLDEAYLQQPSNRHTDVDKGIYAVSDHVSQTLFEEEGTKEEIGTRNFARYGSLAEYSSCFMKDTHNMDKYTAEEKSKLDGKKSSPDDDDDVCGSGTDKTETENTNMQEEKEEPFQPSEEQLEEIPLGIALPKTTRHNNIIELTASRIASNNQLEVFLKVKQASNVDFAFLNPKDELHRYYQHVKAKHGNGKNDGSTNETSKEKDNSDDNSTSDNPLSGLLGGYASSSSSCDGSSSVDLGKEDGISSTSTNKECKGKTKDTSLDKGNGAQPDIDTKPTSLSSDEQDRKRKADRLERLKAWKESRMKQDSDDIT